MNRFLLSFTIHDCMKKIPIYNQFKHINVDKMTKLTYFHFSLLTQDSIIYFGKLLTRKRIELEHKKKS
jgi:hypothetical protein